MNFPRQIIVCAEFGRFRCGHVRFFEEAVAHDGLYVIVGRDANVRLLRGDGHPLLPATKRGHVAGSIRHVKQALISSGSARLDADPKIQKLPPDSCVMNGCGDKGGRRECCGEPDNGHPVFRRAGARPAEACQHRIRRILKGEPMP